MQTTAKTIKPFTRAFILLAVLAIGISVFYFLKTYFYPTITGSQNILVLQKSMAAETINLTKFNNLVKNINDKTAQQPGQETINDPFK